METKIRATIETGPGVKVIDVAWTARDVGMAVRREWEYSVRLWAGERVFARVAFIDWTGAIVIVTRTNRPGAVAVHVRPCESLNEQRAAFARGMEG